MESLDREARLGSDAATKKSDRAPQEETALRSGPEFLKPSTIDAFQQGMQGSANLSGHHKPVTQADEGLHNPNYGSARSESDDSDDDEDIVMKDEAPEQQPTMHFDPFTRRLMTEESRAAAAAARAAGYEKRLEQERWTASVELENADDNSLFDADADLDELFEESGSRRRANTSAPAGENALPRLDSLLKAPTLSVPGPPPPIPHSPTVANTPITLQSLNLPRLSAQQLSASPNLPKETRYGINNGGDEYKGSLMTSE
jgi:hypothetical protein